MSKVGKKPIIIPAGIDVAVEPKSVVVKDAKRALAVHRLRGVEFVREGETLVIEPKGESKQVRSAWGTQRALIQNAIDGLMKGYEKSLILEGVGYKMALEGKTLVMSLGFSHPVKYEVPEGLVFEVAKNVNLKITGYDKALVGQTAAEIRALKKPEPYKGKGFRYSDEVIKRKAGKKAAAK